MDDILVPPFQYKNIKERKTSHDCPTYVLRLRYVGNNPYRCNKSLPTITLTNKYLFTILPFQFKKIHFFSMVMSSIPATSFVYGSDLVFRLGLSCIITFIPTNDISLYIIVYNHTNQPLSFPKNSLQFNCTTALTYQPTTNSRQP